MKDNPYPGKSFEKLFRDYFRPLTVYAKQFVRDQELAEDIVQDLFLYLYEKRESSQFENPESNYLFKLVRFRCINKLKHYKVRTEKHQAIYDSLNPNTDDPHELAVLIELENKYLEVLESLSPRCRKVFEMSRLEGKKNQEIAEELRLSKRTVETHITLALRVLRKKLRRYLLSGLFTLWFMRFLPTCESFFNCYY